MKKLALLLTMLPLVLLADIGPRPTYIHRLHRVGYEILPEADQYSSISISEPLSAGLMVVVAALILGALILFSARYGWMTEIRKTCSGMVKAMRKHWGRLTFMLVAFAVTFAGWKFYRFGKDVLGLPFGPVAPVYVEEPGWKYQDAVSEDEQGRLMARFKTVKPALQEAVDDSGLMVDRELHWQERGLERQRKIDALTTILAQDSDLRTRCRGIPIEYMVDELVFGRYCEQKEEFKRWAASQSPRLSSSENAVLFKWQFFVCRKERRNWKAMFGRLNKFHDEHRERIPVGCFEDFADRSPDGADFVKSWYEKAVRVGYRPDATDQMLLDRANVQKKAANPKVILSAGELVIKGALSSTELSDFCNQWKCGGLGRPIRIAGMDEKMRVSMYGSDENTLRAVCETVGDEIRIIDLYGTDDMPMINIDPLATLKRLDRLSLKNYKIWSTIPFNKMDLHWFVAVNCDLGKMSFLEHVESLSTIYLGKCVFSSTENLGWSKMCCQVTINDAKSVVDLAFVSQLGRLEVLEIVGSKIVNSDALRYCFKLRELRYIDSVFKNEAVLDELRRRGVECEDKTEGYAREAIRCAIGNPATANVKKMIEFGVNIDNLWDTYWSDNFLRNPGFIRQMIENGADPDRGHPLSKMVTSPNNVDKAIAVATVCILLSHGADITEWAGMDTFLRNVLSGKACDGQFELVKLLLAKGVDLNRNASTGKNLLEELLMGGLNGELDDERIEIAKMLLAHGAEVKGKAVLDRMRLWKTCAGKFNLVKELVEKGASITDKSIGSAWPEVEIRKYLLEKVGKKESDYEFYDFGITFSIRALRNDVDATDGGQLKR